MADAGKGYDENVGDDYIELPLTTKLCVLCVSVAVNF